MKRIRLAAVLTLLLSILLAACKGSGYDPFGLSSIVVDADIDTMSELGPDTLARIDEINRTLTEGVNLGDETRQMVNDLNETLRQGVKAGFDDATLERVDRMISLLEEGLNIQVGLDSDTLASVNSLIDQIDQAPDRWQSVSEDIIRTLEGSAGNVAHNMAGEIKSVLNDARLNLQQLTAAAGTEMRCNVDFLGSRAGSTISEFMGRGLINTLRDIVAGKKSSPKTVPIPWVCQMIPDQLTLINRAARMVAERPVVILTGYNFMEENKPEAYLVNEAGERIAAIPMYPYRQSSYQIQLNLQDIDFSPVPARSRVVFKWPNVPDTSAVALLMPTPEIVPTPGPTIAITTRTNVYIGPGEKYTVLGIADTGAVYPASGRNGASSWFQIAFDKKTGWVPASAGRKAGGEIAVVSIPLPPPTANFRADGATGPAPLTAVFFDLSTGDPTRWQWEFGDGGTASSKNPSHTYASAGRFTVKLTVSNSLGSDSKSISNLVIVNTPKPGPVANFTASPRSGIAPLTVHFTDTSSGSPTSWAWTFGDGKSATDRNPTHTYTSAGRYTVTLKAKNSQGENTKSVSEYIVANTQPTTPVLPACYTTETSEEYGPVSCESGFAVRGIKCEGKNCDNMILTCCPYMAGSDLSAGYLWTTYFSEETPNNKYISSNSFMCGLQTQGKYSDRLSLHIVNSPNNKHTGACQTLEIFSEEPPNESKCANNAFVSGVECFGEYCDNIRLTCCQGGK